jgi:hypothetical protein
LNVDSASIASHITPKRLSRGDREQDVSLHVVDSSLLDAKEDSIRSGRTGKSKKSKKDVERDLEEEEDKRPAHKIAFEKFHNQQGVRTVVGSVGPVNNVRMMVSLNRQIKQRVHPHNLFFFSLRSEIDETWSSTCLHVSRFRSTT